MTLEKVAMTVKVTLFGGLKYWCPRVYNSANSEPSQTKNLAGKAMLDVDYMYEVSLQSDKH